MPDVNHDLLRSFGSSVLQKLFAVST
jgi:hypothetical protein